MTPCEAAAIGGAALEELDEAGQLGADVHAETQWSPWMLVGAGALVGVILAVVFRPKPKEPAA